MRPIVIIVAGRDSTLLDGGSESYSRATGRVAMLAGYEPHIFCVGTFTRTEATPFGVVHCTRSPFRPLRGEGVRFRACLAGGGPLRSRHRALARSLGLLSCTVVPDRVPDAFALLLHADVFALPSVEEGSGSVALLEALQAGVAPVVSRVDGLPEDVTEGESALFTEPGDAADLAHALRWLLAAAGLRARLAAGAQKVFHERFSSSGIGSTQRA